MILLAESSSTKAEWSLLENNTVVDTFSTEGINPFFQTRKEISHVIRLQLPADLFKLKIQTIRFYGEGCTTDERISVVRGSLETQFRTPAIVETDLLGAARSLFQHKPGIACILDIDTNTCFYNGSEIVNRIDSVGYVLGDEGSGASLGRRFMADCLKELAPKELVDDFYTKFNIAPREFLDYFYNSSFPNRLLATMSYYLYENLEHPYVMNMVRKEMKSFFERNIFQYDYLDYPIRFIGTYAKMFTPVLREEARSMGIYIDTINETAMKGLVQYHTRIEF